MRVPLPRAALDGSRVARRRDMLGGGGLGRRVRHDEAPRPAGGATPRPRMERSMILLCGATGDLGGRILRQLGEAGAPVRALVRRGADVGALRAAGVETVEGDLRDGASLDLATAGVDTVVTTVTAIGRALAGERVNMHDVDVRGNE